MKDSNGDHHIKPHLHQPALPDSVLVELDVSGWFREEF